MKIAIVLLLVGTACAFAQVPPDFADLFARVAALVDREEVGALDMARGSMDAARLLSVGAAGLDDMHARFRNAATFGEAAVAGVYLTAWGRSEHLALIRRELETNARKREWLKRLVGTSESLDAHLASGAQYQPFLRLLPDLGGTRALVMLLMQSRDPLVRRAGVFWGYWIADANYWSYLRALSSAERDPLTLRLVTMLLRRAGG